ncbi:MAG: ATP-binding protein, partial [Deltaproteobacteria bacterium]|nr:ATP-binding protein [Deltaproteobacteria bacterium]
KTTLIRRIIAKLSYKALIINADEERYHEVLSSRDERKLGELVEGYDLLFIDEAQRVPNIGIGLKILIDSRPKLKIIATGSSSLELARGISEPLTGRKWTYQLFPISQLELSRTLNRFQLQDTLEERLIWGSYPEVFSFKGPKQRAKYLGELSTDYLYKDILTLADVRNPAKIRALLKLLSFQVGSQVSLHEISNSLNISKETVARYIDLLEKSFVLFSLSGFSRNLRKEVSKSKKYYFCDLGMRNAVVENFNSLLNRNDQGGLWENFLISERIKQNAYNEKISSSYFWRTYTGAEIDYVEESGGKLSGFEIKYQKAKARKPETFLNAYPDSTWEVINRENWLDFALGNAEPQKLT